MAQTIHISPFNTRREIILYRTRPESAFSRNRVSRQKSLFVCMVLFSIYPDADIKLSNKRAPYGAVMVIQNVFVFLVIPCWFHINVISILMLH